jgi:predicted dehydrogenase
MNMHRILVVGTGSIGERHVRCLQKTGRAEVGICEISSELRERIAHAYGIQAVHSELDAALSEQWDAAVIATPAHTHIPLARKCAEAGVHLFIEKPLSTSEEGIQDLVALAAEKKLAAGIAYVYRAHPGLARVREAVQSGRIGKPVHLYVVTGQNFPYYRPAYREIYYRDRAMGGGLIQDALTHILNFCEWIVGPVTRLACDAQHQVLEGVDVEDTVNMLARHDSVMAAYVNNQYQAPNEMTMTIVGTEGTVRFESHESRWRFTGAPETPWDDERFDLPERDDLFVLQEEAYLDALEGKRPLLCTLEEGLQTLRANLAALESADLHKWIDIEQG